MSFADYQDYIAIAVCGGYCWRTDGRLILKKSWPVLGYSHSNDTLLVEWAELDRINSIFNYGIYAGMITVIARTTLFPSLVMEWFYGRYSDRLQANTSG